MDTRGGAAGAAPRRRSPAGTSDGTVGSDSHSPQRTMTATFSPGTTFANCRVESLIGRGGMGVVYLATDLSLDRPSR